MRHRWFILVAVLLLVHGTRVRAAATRTAVLAEAAAGPAVTRQEAPFLIDPALRPWTLAGTWRLHGPNAARALKRLQTAQLDLAAWRWQNPDATGAEADAMRAAVMRLKTRHLPPAPASHPGQVTP
jgi:hypothetical protein